MTKLFKLLAFLVVSISCFAQIDLYNQSTYTFTAQSAIGTTEAIHIAGVTFSNHAIQLLVTGTPAGCTYNLEGSLDGTTYTDLSGNKICTSGIQFTIANKPKSLS